MSKRRAPADDTIVSKRRSPAHVSDSDAAPLARQAYAPDPEALRSSTPVRAASPAVAARRSGAAAARRSPDSERVDTDRVDHFSRGNARRRVLWLACACAAAAAAAGGILVLLLPA